MAATLPHNHATARRRTPGITESGPLTNVLAGQDTFFSGPGNGPEYDYPNPRGRAFPHELRTFLCAIPLALLSVALPPGQQHATNPAAKPFPADLRTFVNPTPLNLLGQDAFFAGAGQPPRYDYPNSAARRSTPPTVAGPNNLVLGTVVVAPATTVFDYPNPRGKAFASDLRTWCVSTYAGLAGKDQFFGAAGQPPAYDFSNPTLRKPSAGAYAWAPNNTIVFAPVVIPATTTFDWPNPRGRVAATGIADQFQNVIALGSAPPPPLTTLIYLISRDDGQILAIKTVG